MPATFIPDKSLPLLKRGGFFQKLTVYKFTSSVQNMFEVIFLNSDYKIANISPRMAGELDRFQKQVQHDTGKNIVLVAYEADIKPTPEFSDVQQSGSDTIKKNIFQTDNDLSGNISHWHM